MQTEPQKMTLRQQAAQLLEAVVQERMEPRLAINRWPESLESPDPSLEVAYQALWYFEADEERHRTELFYLDAQLELLRQMAAFLKADQTLPSYMRQAYTAEHQARFYYPHTVLQACRVYGLRAFQEVQSAWIAVWSSWRMLEKSPLKK
jgi:hypothetical protein